MKMSDVELPRGNRDLHRIVKLNDEKQLFAILKKEAKTSKRRYIMSRLIQRINKLRSEEFTNLWMGKLGD